MSIALTEKDLEELSKSQLISFIKRGILRVDMLTDIYPITAMTRFETPEYQQFAHLINIPIGVREAARKYDLPSKTISRWANRGFIQKIGLYKNKVLLDEADVAYCALIRSQNPGAGHWLFNPDGTPYIKKC